MTLPNPKELKALLKVCRDFGVESVEFGEIKMVFGDLPSKQTAADSDERPLGPDGLPLPLGINAEEFEYWSAQPDPKEANQ